MIEFFVAGQPATQGSKRAIAFKGRDGRIHATAKDMSGEKLHSWRALIVDTATSAYDGEPLDGPLELRLTFVRIRPKGHFGTGRNSGQVKDSAPAYPITRPDTVKLTRAVEDALTGVLWRDDSQVVHHELDKTFGDREGVLVWVGRY